LRDGFVPDVLSPGWDASIRGKRAANVGIQGIPGRAGTIRADVRERTREAGRVAGPNDECAGAGGTAWGVLHESEKSNATGDGHTSDRAGVDARKRVGAIGDGGVEEGERGEEGRGGAERRAVGKGRETIRRREIPHSAESVRNDSEIFPVGVMMFELGLRFG
jgi:hypothetical protein